MPRAMSIAILSFVLSAAFAPCSSSQPKSEPCAMNSKMIILGSPMLIWPRHETTLGWSKPETSAASARSASLSSSIAPGWIRVVPGECECAVSRALDK